MIRKSKGQFLLLSWSGFLGVVISLVTAGVLNGWSAERKVSTVTIDGMLIHVENGNPVLMEGQRRHHLTVTQEHLMATLRDDQLQGRTMRLEGKLEKEGVFEVAKLFTLRDDQPHKVRYFCEICNITAVKPGPCACCQGPTELQEILATPENDWR